MTSSSKCILFSFLKLTFAYVFYLFFQSNHVLAISRPAVITSFSEDTTTITPNTMYRYDVQDVWKKHELTMTPFESNPITMKQQQASTKRTLDNPFAVTFVCRVSNSTQCQRAASAFNSSLARIASLLRINTVINVQATFRSFCGNQPASSCNLANTLGQATSAAYFSGKTQDQKNFYFYPQALVKQLNLNQKLNFRPFDILAEFNADANFWYGNEGTSIQPNQPDFQFVICHEVTHGLGFDTNFIQWSTNYQLNVPRNFLAAPLDAQGLRTQKTGDYIVRTWLPMNIFDSFIVQTSTGRNLTDFISQVYTYNPNGKTLNTVASEFTSSNAPFDAAKQIYNIVTGGANTIKFVPSERALGANASANGVTSLQELILYTASNSFSAGSSIAHGDYNTYFRTSDFLMIQAVADLTGRTLESLISNAPRTETFTGVYGPRTLLVLGSLGWPTILNDQILNLEVQEDYSFSPSSSSPGYMPSLNKMILSLVIMITVTFFV